MDMKKTLTTTLIILFLLPFAFAQISVSSNDVAFQKTISPLGEASFDVIVENEGDLADVFVLELSDVAWSLKTKYTPDYTTGIPLEKGNTKEVTVYMKPNQNIAPGTYYVELRIKSQVTKEYKSHIFIITVDPKFVDYSVNIKADVLEPTSIDPAKTNSIKVSLRNDYPVYLENVSVEAKSNFIDRKTFIDVPPKTEKIVEFSLNIDSSTPKQEDTLSIIAKHQNKEIATVSKTLFIKEYKLPYKADVVKSSGFLFEKSEITFTNTEDATKTQDALVAKPRTTAILITVPAAATDKFDEKDYLVWSGLSLGPGESYTVTVIQDYRPIAGAFIAILIIVILYFSYRSPILVKKKAYGVHKKDTGNNEIKVMIHLRNRSGRFIEKVRVLERLPMIHKAEPEFGPSTPEPKFRRQGNAEIILDWDIALAPHEERIFMYKVKSALPVVGEYSLKPCVVQYGHKGRRVTSEPTRIFLD